ncbi:MAG: endonuclease/exonuclease/phosphatase family protein [Planctomycetota bacterium]|nr:endonuclease/exonuclease/phosphatase family protein [Planctomycetota bacterium]
MNLWSKTGSSNPCLIMLGLLILFAVAAGCNVPPARSADPPVATPADETLRVLVWNVLRGGNRVVDGAEKALAVIRASDADLVLMQESYDIDGDRPLLGAWIAEQLGWNQWQANSPHLCILSRFDITERFTHEPWHAVGARLVDDQGRDFVAWSIWIDYRDYITGTLRDTPDISDGDLLESEFVRSSRLPEAQRIIARLKELGHLDLSVPLLVGGDWNTPSHLDWTVDTSRVYKRRRPIDLPVSLAMAEAGFTDTFRTVHPNPVQRPGITWSPMYRTSGAKDQGFERIDRLYIHEPDPGNDDEDGGKARWRLEPVAGQVYPLVWEDEAIPVAERQFPSDHGAVLMELRFVEQAVEPPVASVSVDDWRVEATGQRVGSDQVQIAITIHKADEMVSAPKILLRSGEAGTVSVGDETTRFTSEIATQSAPEGVMVEVVSTIQQSGSAAMKPRLRFLIE